MFCKQLSGTVDKLQVLANFGHIFKLMTIIRDCFSRIIVIYLKIWPELARTCNLSTVQNQLLRVPMANMEKLYLANIAKLHNLYKAEKKTDRKVQLYLNIYIKLKSVLTFC